jgi:MFS family permease
MTATTWKTPLRRKPFSYLMGSQFVGLLGDQLFPLAMVGTALAREGETALTLGAVFAARFLGLGLCVVFGGVVADRLDRYRLMMSADVLRAIAILVIALIGVDAPLYVLAAVTFLLGAGESIYQPVLDATVPRTVPRGELQAANGLNSGVRNLAPVMGPAVAGVMVATLGVQVVLLIDAATFALSFVGLALSRRAVLAEPVGAEEDEAEEDEDEVQGGLSMLEDALEGFRVVRAQPWLLSLFGMAMLHTLIAVGPWFVLLPLIISSGEGGLTSYGVLMSVFAVGGMAGGLLAGRFQPRSPGAWGLLGLSTFGLACVVPALTGSLLLIAVSMGVAGVGTQVFDVWKTSAIQYEFEDRLLGRVFSLDFLTSFVPLPFGQMLAGVLLADRHAEVALLVGGIVVFATSPLPLLVSKVRDLGSAARSAQGGGRADVPE